MSEVSNASGQKKRPLMALVSGVGALILGYLLLWPVPFDPVAGPARDASPAGTGIYAENNALAAAQLVDVGHGPEGIAFDSAGRLYTGLQNGDILRQLADGSFKVLVNTGGRPLGLNFDAKGNLVIADAIKGLISMTPDGTLSTLATDFDGKRMLFVDDLAIASDGLIYFSDASARYEYGGDMLELFERRPSGRLLVYDPKTQQLKLLLDNLYFANGVALSADEDFVLVNETYDHRIMRYWLKGPKAGTADVFADNLPGYIDNITEGPDGSFWLAVVAARTDVLDDLVAAPFSRKIIYRLMQATNINPAGKHSYAVKLSPDGEPLASLEDDSGHIYMMTSVLQEGDKLYLGSLLMDSFGIIEAP